MKVISYKAIKERVTGELKARNNETINKPVMQATYRVTGIASKWQLFAKSFFYGLAGPEGMQGRPWPHKSFLTLAFAAITGLAFGQAEVQNPTFPFWKVMGNSNTNSSTNFVGTTDNVSLRFRTNNTEKMVVDSVGNVGIGTGTPSQRLHVYKTAGDAIVRVETPSSSHEARIEFWKWTGFNAAVGFYPGTSDLRLRTGQASDVIMEPNSTEVMRVRSNGNVGIGITTPTAYLDITGTNAGTTSLQLRSGNIANPVTGINSNQITFGYSGTANYMHAIKTRHYSVSDEWNAIDFYLWDQGTDAVGNVGTKRVMTIDGRGRGMVGIGTASPDTNLHVVGAIKMVDGNQANGYVMVSDVNGVGKWADPSSLSGVNDHNTLDEAYDEGGPGAGRIINATDGAVHIMGSGSTSYGLNVGYSNLTNSGVNSMAVGDGSVVVGNNALSGGYRTYVGSNNSLGFGREDSVIGAYSISFGYLNVASGSASFTANQSNRASGNQSAAFGNGNTAAATNAVAFGDNNNVTSAGTRGAVFNQSNSVTGNNSIAGGFQSNAGGNISFALGYADTATGQGSTAFGFSNIASANYTFAAGSNNNATAAQATAFGNDNTVSATSAMATGGSNTVSGTYSLVSGSSNTLSGTNSLVTGNNNTVTATHSFVSGNGHTVAGNYSVVLNNSNSNTSAATTSITGGYQSQTQSNIGLAIGWADTTTGTAAAAFGRQNRSTANYAFSAGYNNTASGSQSAAFGDSNGAAGQSSFAMGAGNYVSGRSSLVTGELDTITSIASFAMGNRNTVTANGASAFGRYSTAAGYCSIVGGNNSYTRGDYSFAVGNIDTAYANYSFAAGSSNYAGGTASAAFGNDNTVTNSNSFATGDANTVSGSNSFAGGSSNIVSNYGSIALGLSDTASGYTSVAFNRGNYASGNHAVALGTYNSAPSFSELSVGMYSTTYTALNTTGYNAADRLFNVGNGSSSTARADAFTILKNGNVGVGTSTPATDLHVVGSIRMVDGTQAAGYIMTSDANGTGSWVSPSSLSNSTAWSLTGNSSIDSTINFIGTTNNVPFNIRVNNQKAGKITSAGETFLGYQAGNATTSANNTAIGYTALKGNINSGQNTALGYEALTTQSYNNGGTAWNTDNTAVGYRALYSNQPTSSSNGRQNTAIGSRAMRSNTTGGGNVAVGYTALDNNTTASNNTAVGYGAIGNNTTGDGNTAVGFWALVNNTTGIYNAGFGLHALRNNTTGQWSAALGARAAESNTTGRYNVAVGANALFTNSTSNNNTVIGYNAGFLTTGAGNVFIGYETGYNETGSNNLYIDNSNTSTPLILGNFATNSVTINDSLISKYFKMTNGATSGYLLRSDATGNGSWVSPSSLGWSLTGNSGTTDGVNFIGTTDNVPFTIRVNNQQSGRIDPLLSNTFLGYWAGRDNSTGTQNTATGINALLSNSTGARNTAHGTGALESNTGSDNTAVGTYALNANTTGTYNSAFGKDADVASGALTNATAIGAYAQVDASNSLVLGSVDGVNGASATVNVGVGINSPTSTMHINGGFATTVKTAQAAGTNNPDNTAAVWVYSSGTGTITLPAAGTCSGRRYVILNQTGGARTTSTYIDITTASVTSVANNTSIEVISDGTNWRQIK